MSNKVSGAPLQYYNVATMPPKAHHGWHHSYIGLDRNGWHMHRAQCGLRYVTTHRICNVCLCCLLAS